MLELFAIKTKQLSGKSNPMQLCDPNLKSVNVNHWSLAGNPNVKYKIGTNPIGTMKIATTCAEPLMNFDAICEHMASAAS